MKIFTMMVENKVIAKILKQTGVLAGLWLLILNCGLCHAMDEYSMGPEQLRDAKRLELTLGMSFVFESYENVARVVVGDPKIADVRALDQRKILINALGVGTTNLILWHRDNTSQVCHITVKFDISEIKKKLKELVPEAKVELSTSFGMILVSGSIDDSGTMARIMNVIQAFASKRRIKNLMTLNGSQQVQLEAKIVEVSKSAMKRYGLGFLFTGQINGRGVNMGLLPPGVVRSDSDSGDSSISTSGTSSLDSIFQLSSPFANAFQLGFNLVDDDIAGILSFLKGQRLARTMARPTLVAMSGQEASFHVGGSFPVPTEGRDGIGFNNQEYGVELEFVPTVVGKETIHLKVKTSVSAIDYSTSITSAGSTVPGITKREASSTLVLKDGQTFAIAGLLKESINSIVNKVPLLGDIPYVGAAFRSKEYVKEETELIIMVTPRLVTAMNSDEVPPMPGAMEEFNQNDLEFFFLGSIWKDKTLNSENIPQFSGPVGFEN